MNNHSVLVDLYHGSIDPTSKSAIESAGFKILKSDAPLSDQALQSVSVLWITENASQDYQSSEIKSVRSFVNSGGTLICSGPAWAWAVYVKKDNRSYPLNQLGKALGFTVTAQSIGKPVNKEPSPYLLGIESLIHTDDWWPSMIDCQVTGYHPLIRDENLRTMAMFIPSGRGRIFVFGHGALLRDNPTIVRNILTTPVGSLSPQAATLAPISSKAQAEVQLENRLKAFITAAGGGTYELDDKGLVSLNLQDLPVDNLALLKGVPLKSLRLSRTKVRDLGPLKDMPLSTLYLDNTKVSNIAVLKGRPLSNLDLGNLPITDVSTLKGMPLTFLSLWGTAVSDISALRGMPLKRLFLDGTKVRDLSPLKGMPLELLGLWTVSTISDVSPLRGMPLKNLNLGYTQVRDLSPLQGMPLESLGLVAVPATDLHPLKGMALSGYLHAGGSGINDISVLKGMPLKELTLDGCKNLHDLTPLAECRQLERLTIPVHCADIEFLRSLPKLQRLGYDAADGLSKLLPVAEFWKKYDAQKAAAKKPGKP